MAEQQLTRGQKAAITKKMRYGADFYARIGRLGGLKRAENRLRNAVQKNTVNFASGTGPAEGGAGGTR